MSAGAARPVREIMSRQVVTATPDMRVTDAARVMIENRVGALPVLDQERLVGIVTQGDLISQDLQLEYPTYIHLLDGMVMYPPVPAHVHETLERAASASVGDVMTTHPLTVSPDATVADASELIVERGVGRVLVVEGGELLGIVSKSDIVRSLITE